MTANVRVAIAPEVGLEALLGDDASRHGLVVLASAQWLAAETGPLPSLPGFVGSPFPPTVAHVAGLCLRQAYGDPPMTVPSGERVAIMIISPLGDVTSAFDVSRRVREGDRVGPLLFFQSVPHAVAGFVAAHWGLGGPMVCLSASVAELEPAALLIADGDADRVLVVVAEPSRAAAVLVTGGQT